jgi:hypothetical protein
MKALGLLIALTFSLLAWGALLSGCQAQTDYGIAKPPERFATGPVAVEAIFTTPAEVDKLCQMTGLAPGMIGCAGPTILILPYPDPSASHYEALVNHELGHVRGWPKDHPSDKGS